MDDLDVVRRMGEPADEEHRLECSPAGEGLPEEELAPLRTIEVALDQCWDLLRQRHARRAAGGNPDEVAVRPKATVGGYQQ